MGNAAAATATKKKMPMGRVAHRAAAAGPDRCRICGDPIHDNHAGGGRTFQVHYDCVEHEAMADQNPLLFAAMTPDERKALIWQTGGWTMVAGITSAEGDPQRWEIMATDDSGEGTVGVYKYKLDEDGCVGDGTPVYEGTDARLAINTMLWEQSQSLLSTMTKVTISDGVAGDWGLETFTLTTNGGCVWVSKCSGANVCATPYWEGDDGLDIFLQLDGMGAAPWKTVSDGDTIEIPGMGLTKIPVPLTREAYIELLRPALAYAHTKYPNLGEESLVNSPQSHEGDLAEDPRKKEAWLARMNEAFPIGTRVEVLPSRAESGEEEEEAQVGAKGRVCSYDIGLGGSYPLISVIMDDGTKDWFYDDELTRLTVWNDPLPPTRVELTIDKQTGLGVLSTPQPKGTIHMRTIDVGPTANALVPYPREGDRCSSEWGPSLPRPASGPLLCASVQAGTISLPDLMETTALVMRKIEIMQRAVANAEALIALAVAKPKPDSP